MYPSAEVAVEGGGVSAACCTRLLLDAGIPLRRMLGVSRGRGFVLLSLQTLKLLGELFDLTPLHQSGISHPIFRRKVLWGKAPLAEFAHTALAVDEAGLLELLWNSLPVPISSDDRPAASTIYCSRAPEGCQPALRFGTALAHASKINLSPEADPHASLIESTPLGWLFLLPISPEEASLLAVGSSTELLLAESRLVARSIAGEGIPSGIFPASPRMLVPPGGEAGGRDWLACGTAAIAFDPVCGEGAGHAVRAAYLSTAVCQGRQTNTLGNSLLTEYSRRLTGAMLRHLKLCTEFYASGGQSAFWTTQLHRMLEATRHMQAEASKYSEPEYRLVGRVLEPIIR